jgi:hypothetical protein
VWLARESQGELVERLPINKFRHAEPNEGYLLAAALLREGALRCIVTLNFDLAMSSALTQLGAGDHVAVVAGPEEHQRLATVNLIYLHRNANAEPNQWILRSHDLDVAWRNGWEEVIVTALVGGTPVTVFVGLGTPAGVLVESTCRIRNALRGGVQIYLVDPGEREDSIFYARLNLPEDAYIQMNWGFFMSEMAGRLVLKHRAELEGACTELLTIEGWPAEDVGGLCDRLTRFGVVELGRIRARWLNDKGAYVPRGEYNVQCVADLLLAVGLIERVIECRAIFGTDGVVEFRAANRILVTAIMVHGRGLRRWGALEAEIAQNERYRRHREPHPRYAIVSGVPGELSPTVSPPKDIIVGEETHNIVTGGTTFEMLSVDRLRQDPGLILGMLN